LPTDRELEIELRKIKSSLVYTTNQTIASNITFAAVAPILDRDQRLFSALIAVPPPDRANPDLIQALEALVSGLSKNIFGEDGNTSGGPVDGD
jgi:DNA-binding IclR family transcriptional regulator